MSSYLACCIFSFQVATLIVNLTRPVDVPHTLNRRAGFKANQPASRRIKQYPILLCNWLLPPVIEITTNIDLFVRATSGTVG
ncbi:hypothetical protein DFH06DRAFT_1172736 [Mycena polygramma]|nr:hypothetical protein DFH06DRAFT_1172736 [Mycena polygramma]